MATIGDRLTDRTSENAEPSSSAIESVSFLCLLYSVSAGCSKTLAAVVIAYPEHHANKMNYERSVCSKVTFVILNLLFALAETGLKILAVGHGPVAVATPVMAGSTIFSNMVLQPLLGISSLTQDDVLGTLILTATIAMLKDVGPGDVPAGESVVDLLLRSVSMIFLFSCVFLMLACLFFICSGWVKQNMPSVFLYATLSEVSTVLTNASAKALQMDVVIGVRVLMIVLYCLFGSTTLITGAVANGTLDDPSLFIPIGVAVNLYLTCLSGLLVWGDGRRIQLPFVYCMIFIVIGLSSYLVSRDDILSVTHHNANEVHVKKMQRVVMRKPPSAEDARDLTESKISYSNLHNAPRGRVARKAAMDMEREAALGQPLTRAPAQNERVECKQEIELSETSDSTKTHAW